MSFCRWYFNRLIVWNYKPEDRLFTCNDIVSSYYFLYCFLQLRSSIFKGRPFTFGSFHTIRVFCLQQKNLFILLLHFRSEEIFEIGRLVFDKFSASIFFHLKFYIVYNFVRNHFRFRFICHFVIFNWFLVNACV